ncbi:MAG: PstS family phosphate ABC transporter substrate-binding protein [Nitrospirota bacterium]|nr:PstS family phosphate ABC transporter substrate-binding protein [Nitrospirota bacterium]
MEYRRWIPWSPLIVLGVSLGLAFETMAQVRPELDPQIPAYAAQEQISGKLKVAGSDTMKPLIDAWVGDLSRRHPGIKITAAGAGSETGLEALLAHQTEIAAMSRRMTAAEISVFVKEYGYEPTEVPVANDALAIFVHKDNPITGLSLDELDAMFCRERRRGLNYAVDSWGLVGLMDEWFDAPIRLYGRNGKSGTSYLFREEVCKGGTFRPQLINAQGSASVVLDLVKDPQGIGFSAIGYRTSMVKPVPIASVKGGRYVEPNFQTAMDGSYPLRRNLYLYIARPPKTAPSPALAELVRFALSQQGQQLALDHGYFPLSLTELTRLTSKWSGSVKAVQLESPGRPISE